jgi:mRNA interferase MazF
MTRAGIYWGELYSRSGSEQAGRRPVIVVSHDGFNQARNWRSVVVVPMSTSKSQARRGVTAVLSRELLSSVEEGLRAALDLE